MMYRPTHRSFLIIANVGLILSCLSAVSYGQAQPAAETDSIVGELRRHEPAAALRNVDAALKSYPRDPKLWTIKGLAARELGDTATSLTAFKSALRVSPGYLPALEGAAEVAYAEDPAKSAPFVSQLLQKLPANPTANGMAAMLAYSSGNWNGAAEHFSRSGEAVYEQHAMLASYADALARLDRDSEAEPLFKSLIEKWPDDKQARYNLAVLQLRAHEPSDSGRTLQPLIDAQDPQALSLAATAYEAAGDTPRAVALLREAIQQNPREERNYLDFAAISFDHASFSAGLAILDAGLTQLPDSAPLWVAHGVLSMQNSQVERAESDFATANRLDPAQSFGLEAEGLNAIQRHDLPDALTKVLQSLQENPKSAYLNYLAAEILREQGGPSDGSQAERAIRYAKRSVSLDPHFTAGRNTLSALYLKAGDLQLAEQECRTALQIDHSDQEAVYRLILILRRTGDKKQEIPKLVTELGTLRAEERQGQAKLDHYHLVETLPAR